MIKLFLYRLTSYPKRFKKKIKKFYRKNLKKRKIPEPFKFNLPETKPAGDVYSLLYDLKFRNLNCRIILDVGAHSSEWARITKLVFPESEMYLIEPLAEMEENLKKFCLDFPGSKYFLNGAGAKEEILFLTAGDILEGANFLQKENEFLKGSNSQREIKVITIDSLIEKKQMEIPDIVKLDIQGFELEALKGAELLFGKTEVFILEVSFFEFIEGTPIFSEVVAFMAQRGYEVFDFPGFLRRPFDNALGQMDICFVKRNGFIRASNKWL